jgi:hypothetical protein
MAPIHPDRGVVSDRVEDTTNVVSDARTMRALSHPLRVQLLELFSLVSPLTATEAGDRLGESAATCSFHLRQLAKYGFVEEAGGGTGRAHPWRRTANTLEISAAGSGDPAVEVAASALAGLFRERQLGRLQTWLETRSGYPEVWREAATQSESVVWMTSAELVELTDGFIDELKARFLERRADPSKRPGGALPVELLLYAYPMTPPSEEQAS